MMLRASAEKFNTPLNPPGITDPTVASGIVGAESLGEFVAAVIVGTADDRRRARSRVVAELGHDALVDAAGTIGAFEMMNRVAEGTGMPVSSRSLASTEGWRTRLGIRSQTSH